MNPNSPYLPLQRAVFLQSCPLIALGVLDKEKRPWTTLWGGHKGFVASLGNNIVGMTALVDRKWDPVIELFEEGTEQEESFGKGCKISALAIDLESRRRLKFAGEVLGTLFGQKDKDKDIREGDDAVVETQLVLKVESSLGKYSIFFHTSFPQEIE